MKPVFEQHATVELLVDSDAPMTDFDHGTQQDVVRRHAVAGDTFEVISEDWDSRVGCWKYNLQLADGSGWRLWDVAEEDLEEVRG